MDKMKVTLSLTKMTLAKIRFIIGHRMDFNGVEVRRGQRHIHGKY